MLIKQSHGWWYNVPINKAEWDAGRTYETLEGRILSFLRNNKGKGFTLAEIIDGIAYRTGRTDFWGFVGNVAAIWAVQNSLETLVKEGTVRAKIVQQAVGEETYYMAK